MFKINERVVDQGTRSAGEFFMEWHTWRKNFPFLYYCKVCVRNFEKKERVSSCPYCKKEKIIELPKTYIKKNKYAYVEVSGKTVSKKLRSFADRIYLKMRPRLREETPSIVRKI